VVVPGGGRSPPLLARDNQVCFEPWEASWNHGDVLATICSPPPHPRSTASGRCWGGVGCSRSPEVLDDCGHAGTGQSRVEMGGDGVVMESQQARPGVSKRQPTKWGGIEQARGRVPAKKDGGLCREAEGEGGEKKPTCERQSCVRTSVDASIQFRRCLPRTRVVAIKHGLRSPWDSGFGDNGHDGRSLPPCSELTCSSSNDQAWRGGKVWVCGTHMGRRTLRRYKKQGGALVIFSLPEDNGKESNSPLPSSLRLYSAVLLANLPLLASLLAVNTD
jgi:hypothetical protein